MRIRRKPTVKPAANETFARVAGGARAERKKIRNWRQSHKFTFSVRLQDSLRRSCAPPQMPRSSSRVHPAPPPPGEEDAMAALEESTDQGPATELVLLAQDDEQPWLNDALTDERRALLQALFSGYSRVIFSCMCRFHGPRGDLLMRAVCHDRKGRAEELMVVRLGQGEHAESSALLHGMGDHAGILRAVRGPIGADNGERAWLLEVPGACWHVPLTPYHSKVMDGGGDLIITLESRIARELARAEPEEAMLRSTVRQLLSVGSALREAALHTANHDDATACAPGGWLRGWLQRLADGAATIFLLPVGQSATVAPPVALEQAINALESSRNIVPIRTSLLPESRRRKYANSFVHACPQPVWGGTACKPLVDVLDRLNGLLTPGKPVPPWLSTWRPLCAHQHGDLQLCQILIDAGDSPPFLVGLTGRHASASGELLGTTGPWMDSAKLIASCLFEQYPFPEVNQAARLKEAIAVFDRLCVSQPLHVHALEAFAPTHLASRAKMRGDPLPHPPRVRVC